MRATEVRSCCTTQAGKQQAHASKTKSHKESKNILAVKKRWGLELNVALPEDSEAGVAFVLSRGSSGKSNQLKRHKRESSSNSGH